MIELNATMDSFSEGESVVALFPETDTFYDGTIHGSAQGAIAHDCLLVKFNESHNQTSVHPINAYDIMSKTTIEQAKVFCAIYQKTVSL